MADKNICCCGGDTRIVLACSGGADAERIYNQTAERLHASASESTEGGDA